MPINPLNPWRRFWEFAVPGAATPDLPADWKETVKFCVWKCDDNMLITGYLQFDNSRQLSTMLNYAEGSYWKPSENSAIIWSEYKVGDFYTYGSPLERRAHTPASRKRVSEQKLLDNDDYWKRPRN